MARLELVHSEMQAAFKRCAILPRIAKVGGRSLCTSSLFRARRDPSIQPRPPSVSRGPKDSGDRSGSVGPSHSHAPGQKPNETNVKTELVPRTPRPGSLRYPQRSDVPARVLPRAQISPGLTLSPKERMRIEFETRRPPKPPEKPCKPAAVLCTLEKPTSLMIDSLQGASANLSWWIGIHKLHSPATSPDYDCRCVWSYDHGSSLLQL